jgi:hypothetical protein
MTPDISEAQQQRNDRIIVLALTYLTLLWKGSPEFYHLAYEQLPKRHRVQIWQEQLNPDRNGGHNAFTIEDLAILPKGRSLQSSASLLSIYGIVCKRPFFSGRETL